MSSFLHRPIVVCGALISSLWVFAALADEVAKETELPVVPGRIVEVTLYNGQALVTRSIPLEARSGPMEIVIGPLPEHVLPDSLYAEAGEGVEIRAVRYRSRAVGADPREQVRKLDEAIEEVAEQIRNVERQQQVLEKQRAFLDQLDTFVPATMKSDLARGVLDATALEKLTQLTFSHREALAGKSGELERARRDLQRRAALLQRQRSELAGDRGQAIREAVLFLEKRSTEKEELRFCYLVSNCGWHPSYTFRAGKDRKQVDVQCHAIITQRSGEDWNGVQLTLSTASPALSASGPGLAPFPISLMPVEQLAKPSEQFLGGRLREVYKRKAEAAVQQQKVVALEEKISSSWMANVAAGDYQTLELAVGKELLAAQRDIEKPSLSYTVANPVSIASRSDQQMVQIMRITCPAMFYHVAVPILSNLVYREAELQNRSGEDLLAGPITVYLDGRFVGRAEIPTVARGQTFVVGFGADPQLRAARELVQRNEVVQGGNREMSFKYRLLVENFKEEAVALRLYDRMPYSDHPTEIRIRLGELKDPLSQDPLYLRTERPKNILRWDLEVSGGASGEKARVVEYEFTLEFDRNLTISIPGLITGDEKGGAMPPQPALDPLRMEFEQMQRSRMTH